jgi:hypothetical protein
MLKTRHLLPVLAVLPTLFLVGCGARGDDGLIEDFRRDRPKLEQLVTMFQQDVGLGRVAPGFTLPDDPDLVHISFDRIDEYRALCREVRAKGCIEGYDATFERLTADRAVDYDEEKTVIWIHLDERDQKFKGKAKGYLYSEKPPYPVIDSLDDLRYSNPGTWVRHIEGPWYLYFDYRD